MEKLPRGIEKLFLALDDPGGAPFRCDLSRDTKLNTFDIRDRRPRNVQMFILVNGDCSIERNARE